MCGQFCLYIRMFLFALELCYIVAKGHKAVTQMHIFNDHIGKIQRQIIVAEVPEALDPKFHKCF